MKLCETLTDDTIAIGIPGPDKPGAIAGVAELLRPKLAADRFDEFLKAVYARESEATTGIGESVAIPHARTDSVSDFVAALGVCRDGVDFEAIDGKPVKLVILMGIPTHKIKAYLRFLAHMSLLLKQPGFIDRIVAARCSGDVLDALAEFEA